MTEQITSPSGIVRNIPADVLPENLRRNVLPQSPLPMRLMAARSMVPMAPRFLITTLAILTMDGEKNISEAARRGLKDTPDGVIKPALGEQLHPHVFDILAEYLIEKEELIELVVINDQTPDETVAWIASQVKSARILEIISQNQRRFLAHTHIIESLYFNKATPISVTTGVIELAVRNGIMIDRIPMFKEISDQIHRMTGKQVEEYVEEGTASPDYIPPYLEEVGDFLSDDEFTSVLDAMVGEAMIPGEAGEDEKAAIPDDEFDEETKESLIKDQAKDDKNLQALISKMNVAQKIRLALMGNKSARNLLIRNPLKNVSMAVMRNPRLTESEILTFAQNKSLNEDCVRMIAGNREWYKIYQIRLAMVMHPKTPTRTAMRLMKDLFPKDLKSVAKSREIPLPVSREAKKLMQLRDERRS